jgi:cellulose synthase/poly-beta-1,6-N-acetylglucosamine synthase-like glycosyltransferase
MISLAAILSLLALGAWIYLVYAHAGFWRSDQWLGPIPGGGTRAAVVAIIPARNEAETIARTAQSLMAQSYDGPFAIVIVDDSSRTTPPASPAKRWPRAAAPGRWSPRRPWLRAGPESSPR